MDAPNRTDLGIIAGCSTIPDLAFIYENRLIMYLCEPTSQLDNSMYIADNHDDMISQDHCTCNSCWMRNSIVYILTKYYAVAQPTAHVEVA